MDNVNILFIDVNAVESDGFALFNCYSPAAKDLPF